MKKLVISGEQRQELNGSLAQLQNLIDERGKIFFCIPDGAKALYLLEDVAAQLSDLLEAPQQAAHS